MTDEKTYLRKKAEKIAPEKAVRAKDAKGKLVGHSAISDVNNCKRAEAYREITWDVLQILNEQGNMQASIQRVLTALKTQTGFDAVGIRLQYGDDFPYFAQEGFPPDFLLTENTLIERAADGGVCRDKDDNVCLECTCGLVISGKTDPANRLFTRGGSFWTGTLLPIPDIPTGKERRLRPRDRCIHRGYASMALVPIRNKDRIVGLIHLNDRRKGCFTLETVELLEGIAAHIGAALTRKQAEEALQRQTEELLAYNDGLSRFNRAAIGRELRMIELKREVNDLCGKLGEPPRYLIAEGDATPPDSTEAQA